MSFKATLERRSGTAIIYVQGDLDASSAATFQEVAAEATDDTLEQLVLELSNVAYISSAGLRQLVYARQRMADRVRVILVGVNPRVAQTIRLVGFDQSVTFADVIPPTE